MFRRYLEAINIKRELLLLILFPLLIFFIVFLILPQSKDINTTLICEDSRTSSGTVFKSIYLIELDVNKKKVYIKNTDINPFYSARENKAFNEAGLYKLIQKEYEEEKWTRKFKNIKGNIVWREKYGTWTLNRETLNIRVLGDEGAVGLNMYCRKSKI